MFPPGEHDGLHRTDESRSNPHRLIRSDLGITNYTENSSFVEDMGVD